MTSDSKFDSGAAYAAVTDKQMSTVLKNFAKISCAEKKIPLLLQYARVFLETRDAEDVKQCTERMAKLGHRVVSEAEYTKLTKGKKSKVEAKDPE